MVKEIAGAELCGLESRGRLEPVSVSPVQRQMNSCSGERIPGKPLPCRPLLSEMHLIHKLSGQESSELRDVRPLLVAGSSHPRRGVSLSEAEESDRESRLVLKGRLSTHPRPGGREHWTRG